MIDIMTAFPLLGKQVVINDGTLRLLNVRLEALRPHPSDPASFVLEVSTGNVFTSSLVTELRAYVDGEEGGTPPPDRKSVV